MKKRVETTQSTAFQVHTVQLLSPHMLNPAAYNPRQISVEKFEALKRNIRDEGFLEPLVVQKNGLGLIGGHQRLRAVKEICIEDGIEAPLLPCIVLDIDDKRAKKLNIKLNNLKGEFEARKLGELLIDLFEDDPINIREAELLGFSIDEANKFIHLIDPPFEPGSIDDQGQLDVRQPTLNIEFASIEVRDGVKKLLAERSTLEKKKDGDIIAAALGFGLRKKTSKKKRAA